MIRYYLTVFLSAFLLFAVQPLAAKFLIPAFGGSATVWTSCMMFFQLALLVGYLYAHGLRKFLTPGAGFCIHCMACMVSIFLIKLGTVSYNAIGNSLAISVASQLTSAIGIPFAILSATAPLIQAWHSISHRDSSSTYRLYAYSNLGSMIALVGYPFVASRIGITNQIHFWWFGFVVFVILLTISGLQIIKFKTWPESIPNDTSHDSPQISLFQILIWMFGTSIGSALLVSTTNILCQEVASFPFLWILPLVLYLVSFMICFDKPEWYRRTWAYPLFMISVFAAIVLLHLGTNAGLTLQSIGFGSIIFSGAMICHGEVYRLKPAPIRLTEFYLCIAFGGALGSSITVLLTPQIFDQYFEFHYSIFGCLILMIVCCGVGPQKLASSQVRWLYATAFLVMVTSSPVISSWLFLTQQISRKDMLFRERNEYGIVSVTEADGYRKMLNGQTNHGGQFTEPGRMLQPSAYYANGSGADIAFELARKSNESLSVGVIGLGTGSLLSRAEPADSFRFYEINPLSLDAAQNYFTFLKSHESDVVIGDGRLQLNRENQTGAVHQFDILFVDAFSSDSIPVHLMTTECVDLYLRNIQENGLLVFHITNKFIDLMPVCEAIKQKHDLFCVLINHENIEFGLKTKWVVMARHPEILETTDLEPKDQLSWPEGIQPLHWTDDLADVGPLVKWSSQLKLER